MFMLMLMLEVQKGVMVLLILAFRVISVIRTIHLSEQPPDQSGSDNNKLRIHCIIDYIFPAINPLVADCCM